MKEILLGGNPLESLAGTHTLVVLKDKALFRVLLKGDVKTAVFSIGRLGFAFGLHLVSGDPLLFLIFLFVIQDSFNREAERVSSGLF